MGYYDNIDKLEFLAAAGNNPSGNYFLMDNFTYTAVPIPPTALLMGSGLLGLVGLGWRRRRGETRA